MRRNAASTMVMFRFSSFRRSLSIVALGSAAVFAAAQQAPTSSDAFLNPKLKDAADPYRATPSRPAESLARFEALNAQTPDDPDVLSWLGFLYIRTGAPDKAIPPLEKASAMRPDNLEVQTNLGNAYFSVKPPQYEKALASYMRVSAAKPNMPEPHYNMGVIFLQQGAYARAIQELKVAESLKKDAFVENNLGVAYERSGDETTAAAKFREASDLRSDDPNFARNAGLAILRSKPAQAPSKPYYDRARPYLERADPNDPAVALALGSMYMSSDRTRALTLYANAEKAIEKDPHYETYTKGQHETYWYNVGVLRYMTHDSDGALRAYDRALAIVPNDVEALKNVGILHLVRARTLPGHEGEYAEAEAAFEKRIEFLRPLAATFDDWKDLGLAAAGAHDRDKSIHAYQEACKVGKSSDEVAQVRIGLADELYAKGDKTGAESQYRQALVAQPNRTEALNGLGLIYLDEQKLPQAEAAFRGAIKADPTNAIAYNNLAVSLDRAARSNEAISTLEQAPKAVREDPSVVESLHRLKLKLKGG